MTADEFYNLKDEDKLLALLADKRYAICVKNKWHLFISKEEAISLSGKDSSFITIYNKGEWTIWEQAKDYFGVSPK